MREFAFEVKPGWETKPQFSVVSSVVGFGFFRIALKTAGSVTTPFVLIDHLDYS